MPTVPESNKCTHLGCGNERSPLNSYCMEHGGKKYNESAKRKKFNAWYSTPLWRKARIRQLSKQPICQSCALINKVSLATEVDHLFPWANYGAEAFTYNVLQSLCKECHSVKTNLEQQGIYRHFGRVAKDYGPTDYPSAVKTLET